jgi:two-component system, NarL family, response regulator DevR
MDDSAGEIGVIIVDDHRMFAESLARLLADEEGISVRGVGANRVEALQLMERFEPRVLLIDYHMPDGDGVAVASEIKAKWPETMVVMLTGDADDQVLIAAIEAGCSGFFTKDRASSEVAEAVRVAAAGEALISPSQLVRLLPRLNRTYRPAGADLTERELEVLNRLASGATNKVIAAELFLSVNTIRNYVQSILTKLDAHSKLEAVATAVRQGIIAYPSGS